MDGASTRSRQEPRAPRDSRRRPPAQQPRPQRWTARSLILMSQSLLAGVGGVYLGTGSVTITLIAAGLAALALTLVLVTQR